VEIKRSPEELKYEESKGSRIRLRLRSIVGLWQTVLLHFTSRIQEFQEIKD